MPETLIYKCWCKGTTKETGTPRYSQNWTAARRGMLVIYAGRAECGDWVIPFSDVTKAVIYKTPQWFIPVNILHLEVGGKIYQFGCNPWSRPARHMDLRWEEQRVRLKYSIFSLAIRFAFLGGLLYWIIRTLS